ncbi:GNAT family N-acetyltransferase [Clostridium botulinum]|nr:GNAT family N-acetyltransferase [Clostridium botulinum]
MIKEGKIFLKLLRSEDIDYVCDILKDQDAKLISDDFGENIDVEKRKKIFKDILESNTFDKLHFLAYTVKSKKIIGYSFIAGIDWIKGSAELVVIVKNKYIGIGYGSIINLALIDYCFKELNLKKVYCEIRIDNKNIPDRVDGDLMRSLPIESSNGILYHSYYYRELLKKDWVKNEMILNLRKSIN